MGSVYVHQPKKIPELLLLFFFFVISFKDEIIQQINVGNFKSKLLMKFGCACDIMLIIAYSGRVNESILV